FEPVTAGLSVPLTCRPPTPLAAPLVTVILPVGITTTVPTAFEVACRSSKNGGFTPLFSTWFEIAPTATVYARVAVGRTVNEKLPFASLNVVAIVVFVFGLD